MVRLLIIAAYDRHALDRDDARRQLHESKFRVPCVEIECCRRTDNDAAAPQVNALLVVAAVEEADMLNRATPVSIIAPRARDA